MINNQTYMQVAACSRVHYKTIHGGTIMLDPCPRASGSPNAAPGASPGRGLLILRCESPPPLCVGLVWTFDLLADVIKFQGLTGD